MIPIEVKRPVLLDASLQPVRVLNAEDVDLVFNSPGISQATIRLPHDEPEPALHSFVEVFYIDGSAGVFRVSVPSQDYVRQQSIVLRHGIDTLADSVYKAQLDFEGTVAQLLSNLLSYQTTKVGGVACWQLGTCEDNATVKISINYNRLSDVLAQIEEDQEGYYFEYDQSSFPWTLHFRARPATVGTQFRRGRNIRTISRTLNDNDLCTQLILSVNVTTTVTSDTGDATSTDTVVRTYDNAAAQAIWGVIQRTADIDTNDNITAGTFPEADAWAQKFLADHATPTVQMQIDGDEYFTQTGDTLDRARLNYLCAVPLPEYGQDFEQRIVSVHYPNALSDPRHVTASLATQLPKFSTSIRSLQKQTAANARASRSIARSAAKAKEMTHWSMVVTDQQLALDGTGIMQLYESGIDMDAQGGVVIYNLAQGLQSLYSGIEVQAGRINLVVQGEGTSASIKIQAIVDGINGSVATINANHIKLNASDTITLDAKLGIAANGLLKVNGGAIIDGNLFADGSLYLDDDLYIESGHTIQFNDGLDYVDYYPRDLRFGFGSSGFVKSILSSSATEIAVGMEAAFDANSIYKLSFKENTAHTYNTADLTHYHNITATEGTGQDAGKILFTLGAPRSTEGTTNFNIAATQFYLDHVAAAYANAVNRVSWPTTPRTQSSFSVSVPGNPWNASTEAGTTLNRIFALSAGSFDSNHITTVELAMSHNENGQAVTDGVVAKIDVDASAVYLDGERTGRNSVTISNSDIVREINDLYNATTHNTTIYIKATASNGAQGTQSFTVSGADAYSDGVRDGGGTAVASSELLVSQDDGQGGQIETQLIDGRQTVNLIAGELCEIDLRYNGNYIKWGYVQAPSLSIGTPFINNPQAGYISPAVTIDGYTYYGETIKLTNQRISDWGGPIT